MKDEVFFVLFCWFDDISVCCYLDVFVAFGGRMVRGKPP